jgi:uncharacterized protein YbjT (DUF2867 family)
MILVTGATGSTGSHVVHSLVARGARVRVFVRDAERARLRFGDAVEIAEGDLAFPPSLRTALVGADALFLSCADDPRRVGWETDAIDAAAAAGVGRIVRLSALPAAIGAPVAFWDWHGRVDDHLRASGVAATVLGAGFYASNLLAAADGVAVDGRLYAPAGDARIALIDPRDVGEAAAAVLTAGDHAGATYALTGPDAITYAEVAAHLSAVLGRRVDYTNVPDEAARQAMVDAGLPPEVAEQVVAIFAETRRGALARTTSAVQHLTGRPPRGVAAFLRDHADAFQPILAR